MGIPARPRSAAAVAVVAGVAHAAMLFGIEAALESPVGASHGSVPAVAFSAVGLGLLAAVPVALALRYGLVAPPVALVGATGFVVAAELSPSGPTFPRLGRYTAVDDGLFVSTYPGAGTAGSSPAGSPGSSRRSSATRSAAGCAPGRRSRSRTGRCHRRPPPVGPVLSGASSPSR